MRTPSSSHHQRTTPSEYQYLVDASLAPIRAQGFGACRISNRETKLSKLDRQWVPCVSQEL